MHVSALASVRDRQTDTREREIRERARARERERESEREEERTEERGEEREFTE